MEYALLCRQTKLNPNILRTPYMDGPSPQVSSSNVVSQPQPILRFNVHIFSAQEKKRRVKYRSQTHAFWEKGTFVENHFASKLESKLFLVVSFLV